MSVQSEIDRISQNVESTYAVLSALGADMPAEQNSANLAKTAGSAKVLLYSSQTLDETQQGQARTNIAAEKTGTAETKVKAHDESETSHPDIRKLISQLSGEIVRKNQGTANVGKILMVGTDGNLILANMPSTDDVVGTLDGNNNILFSGNIPNGTYTLSWVDEDGNVVGDAGTLVVGEILKVNSISATKTKTSYTVGDTLTTNDITVTATYSDGSTAEVTDYSVDSSGVQMGTPGTYDLVVSYDGQTATIGITVAEAVAAYTNLLPLATNADGTPFVGDNGEDGYKYGYRIKSSTGEEAELRDEYCAGFMPMTASSDIIRFKNITLRTDNASYNTLCFYDADYSYVGALSLNNATETDGVYSIKPSAFGGDYSNAAYFRFCCSTISADTIVTVNEEIV